jgi:hypothetical protein
MSRWVDRGAVVAGFVGLGMAVTIALGLVLVVAVPPLVLLAAPIAGLLIGFYANARSGRRRPWWRVLANSGYAGLVTGVSLALLYAGLGLLFLYADGGFREAAQGGPIDCQRGPACTYARYLDAGQGSSLEALGVTDAARFERYLLRGQLVGGTIIAGSTVAFALLGGAVHGLTGGGQAARSEAAT